MRRDTLSFSMDVAAAKWQAAKSENELIYHEPVIPVLSDNDDSDCLKSISILSVADNNRPILERMQGACLVKTTGFVIEDPELLNVVVSDNKESSNAPTVSSRTLFRDLVPADTQHQANIYRSVLFGVDIILLIETTSLAYDCLSVNHFLFRFRDIT